MRCSARQTWVRIKTDKANMVFREKLASLNGHSCTLPNLGHSEQNLHSLGVPRWQYVCPSAATWAGWAYDLIRFMGNVLLHQGIPFSATQKPPNLFGGLLLRSASETHHRGAVHNDGLMHDAFCGRTGDHDSRVLNWATPGHLTTLKNSLCETKTNCLQETIIPA